MIAFVQPFGLHSEGGGPRILRSLLAEADMPYVSVCTAARAPQHFDVHEVHLPVRPYVGRLEHTRVARYLKLDYLTLLLADRFKRRLRTLCVERGVTAIHAIPHGIEFWYAFEVAQELGLSYVINSHDDLSYNLAGSPVLDMALEKLGVVWRAATARIVISEAMGEEYNRRYGQRPYEIITDGLTALSPGAARRPESSLRMYMMGSIHLSYRRNFEVLLEALSQIRAQNQFESVSLMLRPPFAFSIDTHGVPTDARPWGTQADIENDLTEADLLYFPLPFESEFASFSRFSMSTKLVTYLGTGLPILYHGPTDAAAGRLLATHDAAIQASTLTPEVLAERLIDGKKDGEAVTRRALALARSQFRLSDLRRRFWGILSNAASLAPEPPEGQDGRSHSRNGHNGVDIERSPFVSKSS